MTTAVESKADPQYGAMVPRVYTPPLESHCTGPAEGIFGKPEECPCGCGLNPLTSWGFYCNAFSESVLKWKLLPYQKWLNIHALEKDDEDGGFRFKILVVLVSRQQGKTTWLRQLGLWRLFVSNKGNANKITPGARLALIAAQNLQYAEGVLKDVVDEIRDNPLLAKELINHRVTNGNHRAILTNRRYWRAATASRKGGRSLSVDIAMLDELREHTTTDAWDAIAPTTLVRPFSQVVCTSNAGDARSIVLRDLRDAAIRKITSADTSDTRTGLFEWSVPDDVDPRDESYWYLANPALGHLNNFKLSDLRSMFEAQQYRNLPGFQTEHLALDIATPILTPSGWTTMGDIDVGDQVYHPDGHPIDVIHTTEVFNDRQCYEVVTTDGRKLVADSDHRWMVNDRRSNRGWETLTTADLVLRGTGRNNSGGKFAYRLPRQHAIVSKPLKLPIDPYLLGAWLGDGTTGKAEITCIESDADELTRHLGVNVTSTRNTGTARRINFRITPRKSRNGFPARCRDLGIWADKRIPDIYLRAGTEQRLALIQGLCDTDGSIDANSRVRYCSTNKEMAEQVLYLARSLGWRATLCEGVSKFGDKVCGAAYYVGWTHDAEEPSPFRLQRKLARINNRPSRARERTTVSIRSISPVSSRPTRCITVNSPDSLWLAGRDLIPTQNCQWVDALKPGIIPAEHWAYTTDKNSRPADDVVKFYAGLDVNYDRSRSYVAIAARRADGDLHIEVVQAARGTEWIIPWLQERKNTWLAGIAVQKTGSPVSGMIDDLQRAGIPVVEWGPGVEVAGTTGFFYDQIIEHKIFHRPAPVLDRAAASGVSRSVGEGFVFDRRNSLVDVSPLIACVAAIWLERQPHSGPMIHSWPDEDTIRDWDQEGGQMFKDIKPPNSSTSKDGEGTSWWTR